MPYAQRDYLCAGCGAPVARRAAAGAEVRCILCAVQRAVDNARQISQKSGPWYQRWAAGMARAGRDAEQLAAIAAEIDSIIPD